MGFYHSYPTIRIWLTSVFTLFCLLKNPKSIEISFKKSYLVEPAY